MTSSQETYVDEYAVTGEFHDLFVPHGVWDRLTPAIDDLFGSLPETATLLDIGAGTGLSTRALARRTRAHLIAIEPSVTMRTGLLTRLSDDPDLRARVSVIAEPVPHALSSTGTPVQGFLCSAMLGHLTPSTRIAMFRQLHQFLAPGAIGILTAPKALPPLAPGVHEERLRIGRQDYIARYHHEPGAATQRQEYEVRQDGQLVRSLQALSRWQTPDQQQLREEAAQADMLLMPYSESVAVVQLPERP